MTNRLIAYVIGSMFAVLVLASLSRRLVHYDDVAAVLLFALVVGAINAIVLPALRILTVPLSCLTLGLSTLVLNAVVFAIGALVTVGVGISVWGALIGAILTSIVSGLVYSLIDERRTA